MSCVYVACTAVQFGFNLEQLNVKGAVQCVALPLITEKLFSSYSTGFEWYL